jgi:DNA-directed RNA polymerase specialized sigma subunit
LQPLLATIPARERRILILRFFGNMTQSQIAADIGISQMHVSRLLSQTLGRSPTVADLAKRLDVSEEEIIEGLDSAHAYRALSLQAPALLAQFFALVVAWNQRSSSVAAVALVTGAVAVAALAALVLAVRRDA